MKHKKKIYYYSREGVSDEKFRRKIATFNDDFNASLTTDMLRFPQDRKVS